MNLIAYGDSSREEDTTGMSVAAIREHLRDAFSIPDTARPFVDGRPASPSDHLPPGAELEFVQVKGIKGVGRVWTPEQFCEEFDIGRDDLERWVQQGLQVLKLASGDFRVTETAVDEFVRVCGPLPPPARQVADTVPPLRPPEADMTPIQAAAEIACSRSQVYKLMRAGELAHRRVGRGYRISRVSVSEYKRRHSTQARPPAPPPTTGYRFKHL